MSKIKNYDCAPYPTILDGLRTVMEPHKFFALEEMMTMTYTL